MYRKLNTIPKLSHSLNVHFFPLLLSSSSYSLKKLGQITSSRVFMLSAIKLRDLKKSVVPQTGQTQTSSRKLFLKNSKVDLEVSFFPYKVPQVILLPPAQPRTTVQYYGNTSLFQLEQATLSFFFLLLT